MHLNSINQQRDNAMENSLYDAMHSISVYYYLRTGPFIISVYSNIGDAVGMRYL